MNSSSTAKTILFWISIVFLGVMLWKLVSTNASQAREDEPSYSLLMAKIDAGEIKEVTMYLSPNSYELKGEYSKPQNQKFRAIIAKENSPEVTKALRDKAVQVKVQEVRSGDWVLILLNAAPLILLVGLVLDAADAIRRKQGIELWQVPRAVAFRAAEEGHVQGRRRDGRGQGRAAGNY